MAARGTPVSAAELPDFVTSPGLASMVSAHLLDLADSLEATAAEQGTSRPQRVTVGIIRAAGNQLDMLHAATS